MCHLRQDESIDSVVASMHLSLYENKWVKQKSSGWPLIFSKYQIDDDMEPIIFWKDPDELTPKIAERLKKFREDRVELLNKPEARQYFLRIGRRQPGQAFISNAKIQNNLVEQLKISLEKKAVNFFHYKNKDAITIGTQAWLSEIIRQIDDSDIFIALLDSHYIDSEWCTKELEEAMDLYNKGQIMIHAYVIEEGIDLQKKPLLKKLSEMQLEYIQLQMDDKEEELRLRIVENAIEFLDTPGSLQQIIENRQHFQTGRAKVNPRNEGTEKLQHNHVGGGKQAMIIELLTTATVTAGTKFLFDQLGKMTDRVNDEKLEKIKEKAEVAKTEQDVIAIQKLITETIPDAQKIVSLEAFTAWVEDQIDQDFTELIEVSEITFNVLREKRKREDNLMKKDNIRDMERMLKTSIEEFKQKLRTGEIAATDKGLLYGTITRTLDFINK